MISRKIFKKYRENSSQKRGKNGWAWDKIAIPITRE